MLPNIYIIFQINKVLFILAFAKQIKSAKFGNGAHKIAYLMSKIEQNELV